MRYKKLAMALTDTSLKVALVLMRCAWIFIALVITVIMWWLMAIAQTATSPHANVSSNVPQITSAPSIESNQWSVLCPGPLTESKGASDQRLRLAGTFFSFPESESSSRKAILDNVPKNEQRLVGEGDRIEGIEIVRIYPDHVLVRSPDGEEVLWLSFSENISKGTMDKASPPNTSAPSTVLERTRYGTRIGESRWIMNRDALMEYYRELMDNPERVAKLYVSMKPNYTDDGRIQGYRVNKVGEEEFFDAVGLKEGDVVLKVNSLSMTSQAKAEYFISEFLQGRLSAAILDIEREGQPQKLIYMIR